MASNPPVVRKLFQSDGDDDLDDSHTAAAQEENARNFLNEEMRRGYEDKCLKWNFNFKEGIPLPGNWEWESVIEDEPEGDVEVKNVIESVEETNENVPVVNNQPEKEASADDEEKSAED